MKCMIISEILPFKWPKFQWQKLNLTSLKLQQDETHEGNQILLEEKSHFFFLQLFESKICQWPPPPIHQRFHCPSWTIISSARPSGSSSVLVSPCSPGKSWEDSTKHCGFFMWRKNTRPSKLALSFYWDERYH